MVKNDKYRGHDVNIEPTANDYLLVRVGCVCCAYPRTQAGVSELTSEIKEYLLDPRKYEEEYHSIRTVRDEAAGQAIATIPAPINRR